MFLKNSFGNKISKEFEKLFQVKYFSYKKNGKKVTIQFLNKKVSPKDKF